MQTGSQVVSAKERSSRFMTFAWSEICIVHLMVISSSLCDFFSLILLFSRGQIWPLDPWEPLSEDGSPFWMRYSNRAKFFALFRLSIQREKGQIYYIWEYRNLHPLCIRYRVNSDFHFKVSWYISVWKQWSCIKILTRPGKRPPPILRRR